MACERCENAPRPVDADGEFFFFQGFEPAHMPVPQGRVVGNERVGTREIDVANEMREMVGPEVADKRGGASIAFEIKAEF